jgi:hypothetical protein
LEFMPDGLKRPMFAGISSWHVFLVMRVLIVHTPSRIL